MLRPIIEIDEEKCDGCGQCVTDCAEGALAIVDGKARLISELYCDGLGACLNCPKGALKLGMKEAPAFDEKAALAAKAKRELQRKPLSPLGMPKGEYMHSEAPSWPIQLALIPPNASWLKGATLLLGAHCAGFSLPNIQEDWVKGRIPVIACPKLEDNKMLVERLTKILAANDIPQIDILRMSVPCCALERIAAEAIKKSGAKTKARAHIVKL